MKILNLYAGVGGNRMLWGDEHEITAVEFNESIANCYKELYPKDEVVISDAHQFLLDHYHEFDFIWASPPCQSHSKCNWVIENVNPYYKPFLQPSFTLGKHLYWTNKFILTPKIEGFRGHYLNNEGLQKLKKIDLSKFKFEGIDKRQVLRNMVEPEDGLLVFNLINEVKND